MEPKEGERIRPIPGYEGLYNVSDQGYFISVKRGIVMKSFIVGGYPVVTLFKDREKKTVYVHIEVAKVFLDNPDNLPQVDHIDRDKTNTHYSNLEWVTRHENCQRRSDKLTNKSKTRARAVEQLSLDGKILNTFESGTEAGRITGLPQQSISAVCNGRMKTAGGYKWRHVEERKEEEEPEGQPVEGFPSYIPTRDGRIYSKNLKRFLSLRKTPDGYLSVTLWEKSFCKGFLVHCLVAQTLLPRVEGKDKVNHKDGNKANNRVENLEWCTSKENSIHSHYLNKHQIKGVRCLDKQTNKFICEYRSMSEAQKATGDNNAMISCVCNGKMKSTGTYNWEFARKFTVKFSTEPK